MSDPTDRPDLVERLTEAATRAIANERPALVDGPGQLKGLTLEFELKRSGEIVESRAWVERIGVHQIPRGVRLVR